MSQAQQQAASSKQSGTTTQVEVSQQSQKDVHPAHRAVQPSVVPKGSDWPLIMIAAVSSLGAFGFFAAFGWLVQKSPRHWANKEQKTERFQDEVAVVMTLVFGISFSVFAMATVISVIAAKLEKQGRKEEVEKGSKAVEMSNLARVV